MNEVLASKRAAVMRLEEELRQMPGQFTPEIGHWFGHKCYVRQYFKPAGCTSVGKIHRFPQIHIILSGDVTILTDDGPVRMQGPCIFMGAAGAKRASYSHTDTIWLTVHGTDKTDLDELEDELIAESFEEFEQLDQLSLNLETES
jgi:hypothetical protein